MYTRRFSCPLSRPRSLASSSSASGQWSAAMDDGLAALDCQQLQPTLLYLTSSRVAIRMCGCERAIVWAATDRTGASFAALGH